MKTKHKLLFLALLLLMLLNMGTYVWDNFVEKGNSVELCSKKSATETYTKQ
jgi:hypothetical protein